MEYDFPFIYLLMQLFINEQDLIHHHHQQNHNKKSLLQ